MTTTGEIFAATESLESLLTDSIRDHLNHAHELMQQEATPDSNAPLRAAQHLTWAKRDMQRLLALEKVMYP